MPLWPSSNSSNGYSDDWAPDGDRFDPVKLILLVIRYRWLVALSLVLGVLAGIAYTWQQVPMYRSFAKLEIGTSGTKIIQELQLIDQSNHTRQYHTAIERILSVDLAKRVVFDLDLAKEQDFIAPVPGFSLRVLAKRMLGLENSTDISGLPYEARVDRAVRVIKSNLSAELIRNTSVIQVSFRHQNPQYTSKIANQVVLSYLELSVDETNQTTDLARQFIEERVQQTKEKLAKSERELQEFAEQAKVVKFGDETSVLTESIREINRTISTTVGERLAAEKLKEQVALGNTASLPQVLENAAIQTTKDRITELTATYQEKLTTLKPGFPEMRRIASQIAELKKQLNAEISSVGLSIELSHDQIVAKEKALREELAQYEREQARLEKQRIGYTILQREVDSHRKQFESLIDTLNNVSVGSEIKAPAGTLIDTALTPGSPYTPRLGINMALSLILFGMLSALLIYLLEIFNNTFVLPDQVENELKLPVLGIIPKSKPEEIVASLTDEKTSLSEAYRALRTSIQFTGTENDTKSLLITSAQPFEGKSTTSLKLALDFAALGRNVLLIDADLRKPRLHKFLNMDLGIGLSNLLTNVLGSDKAGAIFRSTKHKGVTFLSAGTIPPNPADILVSEKMALTIQLCTQRFDLVIVDGPPIMGLSDAPILSRIVDGTVLVVAAKQVSRKAAKTALNRLRSVGSNIVGATMTKFSVPKMDYNYAYSFMNENYYGYSAETPKLENKKRLVSASGNNTYASSAIGSLFRRLSGDNS